MMQSADMKTTSHLILIILTFVFINTKAQIILGNYPTNDSKDTKIITDSLLSKLRWKEIKDFAKITQGHYANEKKLGLIEEFEYVKQGYTNFFRIKSFKGFVLSFESDGKDENVEESAHYFNKNLWKEYVDTTLPNLAPEFQIDLSNHEEVLVSYYNLLGVDSRDEYGWICEYSTAGMPPQKRIAVLNLIKYGKVDLLKKLQDFPNIQTQIYSADALIYCDYIYRNKIEESKKRGEREDDYSFYKEYLLDRSTTQKIELLQTKKIPVKICGNNGSYKIHESDSQQLLSKEKIKDIPKNYEMLKELGYSID